MRGGYDVAWVLLARRRYAIMKENEVKVQRYPDIRSTQQPSKKADPFGAVTIVLILAAAGYFGYQVVRATGGVDLSLIKTFNTIFISILMQALPFMLIGIFVSSAMHVFVPDEFIVKIFPTKHGLGFITAMFAGLFFPVCECAIVPVMTRLVKKGVALPIAITFMLSAPIINPIVIVSTLYAFPGQPEIALYRVIFGVFIALFAGLVLFLLGDDKSSALLTGHAQHGCACGHCGEDGHKHALHPRKAKRHTKVGTMEKIKAMFLHSGEEFFSVGKYLILGAFMTSLIQTLVPRAAFTGLGAQSGLSLFIMMATAFLFSACSTSDAFIARSFVTRFSMGSIMGFLVFGPMMDVKNILMLLDGFKKSFIAKLVLLIFLLNFLTLYCFAFLF